MSRNSYTSSERRGIIAIAFAALLIIAAGIVLSLCGRPKERVEEIPIVVEHPESVDSVTLNIKKEESSKKKTKKTTSSKSSKGQKSSKKKTYRKRSPLDEPV